MKTTNKRYSVKADIEYQYIESETECVDYEVELPDDIEEEMLEEELEERVREAFLKSYYGNDLYGELEIWNLDYIELGPPSPMKVMEENGEKTLFNLAELD